MASIAETVDDHGRSQERSVRPDRRAYEEEIHPSNRYG